MNRPSSVLAVGWSPLIMLLLLLLIPMSEMKALSSTPLVKPQASEAVGALMMTYANKFDWIKHFTDLELQKSCTSQLINENDFSKYLLLHYESSMCSIIYNVTKELDVKSVGLFDNLKKPVLDKNDKSSDMYTVWQNVSKISKSPTLNLLMEHLNETKKWNSVCFNFNGNLFPYCEFLNIEVLLLQTLSQVKESALQNSSLSNQDEKSTVNKNNDSKSRVDNTNTNTPDLDATNDPGTPKNDGDMEETELENSRNSDFENTKQHDPQFSIESKDNFSFSNQNKDSSTMVLTDTKIVPPILISSSNKLTNHQDESHFLFYFTIMTVLSMMFYLALYNKKKIIALLIEGRRSTNNRRRPNSTSYSKVETDEGNTVY